MTMVRRDTLFVPCLAGVAGTLLVTTWLIAGILPRIHAEQPPVHYPHAGAMAPGAIGRLRSQPGGPLSGFFQPIEVRAPNGVRVAFAEGGGFSDHESAPAKASLRIADVYRLRITRIPYHAGLELFPTVELIDRLHPPAGKAWEFPVPIQLTQQELEFALQERFVTRVIYVEDPFRAIPQAAVKGEQTTFEVATGDNPLEVAGQLGRPIAILRIGGRVPIDGVPDASFLFGSPPLLRPSRWAAAGGQKGQPREIGRDSHPAIPRLDLRSFPPRAVPPHRPGGAQAAAGWESDGADPRVHDPARCACLPVGTPGPVPYDEYLCDGGDGGLRAAEAQPGKIQGIELEDTIAHYQTHLGETVILPSNRVCIYAPRFSSVRQVDVADTLLADAALVEHTRRQPPHLARERNAPNTTLDNRRPHLQRGRRAPSLAGLREQAGELEMPRHLEVTQRTQQVYQDLQAIRAGILTEEERPLLTDRVEAAIAWSLDMAVQIVLDERPAVALTQEAAPAETFGIDEPNSPRLRILKIASRHAAQPGETVDFTIRFDNTGNRTIQQVSIVDNLAIRLEYVDDSQTCSLPAQFQSRENQGGSSLLRWTLEQPLDVGEGGTISFRVRVR